ncbi:MAG TPA: asparagine synthetase B family protein [Gammaproteobacteria bacterium]|nr:asparagine synthetase B family protein [Gammaproteobacteria bacterium]
MTTGTLFSGYVTSQPDALRDWSTALLDSGMRAAGTPSAQGGAHARGAVTARALPDGRVVLAVGAPYALPATREGIAQFAPDELVAALDRHGSEAWPQVLAGVGGAFAIGLVDPGRREVLLAVDRFAIENLYYVANAQGFAFANHTRPLARHPSVGNRFRLQDLYASLYFHWLPGPAGGYVGVERLLPGQCLHWRDGTLTIRPYWVPVFDAAPRAARAELAAALRESIESAVARRLPQKTPACFLSGGLDSSTVTGYCAHLRPADTVAYTIGFEAEGYDEMEFARTAAAHFGVRHESYYVTPADIVESLPAIVDEFDAPFGNASAIPTYYCAKLAASRGHRSVLAGDGGDELFGGNVRYQKQLVFERYARVPAALRHALCEPLANGLPAGLQRGLLGKAASYVRQATVPLPDRLMTYNLLNFVAPDSFLAPDLLAAIDTQAPLRALREMYAAPRELDPIDKLLRLDWRITLADSDLPKVSRMCALAGIDVSYPMLDESVVDVSLRMAPDMKVTARDLRPLYREAFADFLPPATLTKSKQGFGLPFGVWLHERALLRDFAHDNLAYLEDAGVLARGFRDDFLTQKIKEHPAYFGTLAWILLAMGLWLRRTGVTLM